jgi:hypothetical protein
MIAKEMEAAAAAWQVEEDPTIPAAILSSLRRLAEASSVADANAFQRWAQRHFVCSEAPIALYSWRQVLLRACLREGGMYERVPPPVALNQVLPKLCELLQGDRAQSAEKEILRLAPPPTTEDIELGLDVTSTAMRAVEIVRNEATVAALQLIAKTLSELERDDVAEWAARQANALDMPVNRVAWRVYLDPDPECVHGPPAILL